MKMLRNIMLASSAILFVGSVFLIFNLNGVKPAPSFAAGLDITLNDSDSSSFDVVNGREDSGSNSHGGTVTANVYTISNELTATIYTQSGDYFSSNILYNNTFGGALLAIAAIGVDWTVTGSSQTLLAAYDGTPDTKIIKAFTQMEDGTACNTTSAKGEVRVAWTDGITAATGDVGPGEGQKCISLVLEVAKTVAGPGNMSETFTLS